MKTNIDLEVKDIFKSFVQAIENIKIDSKHFSMVVDKLIEQRKTGGLIITTAMGKASLVMRKFSSTLCSFGFPSVYIHPGEASHGDLGLLTKNDILFVASTSGKTREILEIIDLARNLKIKAIIGITSHPDSPVREKADYLIDMGVIQEAGKLGLAPTTSIIIMLAISDALSLIAAERVGVTKKDFSRFHHGGYLGKLARNDNKIY
jgi:arabinose-5-phosphate isomerase